eukprot:Em0008g278a
MAETAEIVKMFQRQMEEQWKQTEALVNTTAKGMDHSVLYASIPSSSPFDSTSELWSDYWARFQTFVKANSIPADKVAQVFLTNQTKVTYKLLSNMAVQQLPPKTIKELDIDAIAAYMRIQFDPTRVSWNIITKKFRTIKAISSTPLQQSMKIEDQYLIREVSTAKGVDGNKMVQPVTTFQDLKPDTSLQEACNRLYLKFPDLFKHELGCLKDVMLEIKFRTDASPVFCKPRVVPFAIQDDLVQAYEAGIAKESQKRLALSTHQGVYLQRRLSFGISSAPAHFQEIMDQLTSDVKGVAVYVDDIVASIESIEYLGYTLSSNGIAKGSKVDEVGLGAVLFHRYSDGSEHPVAHVSKTLLDTQQNYSQIPKEALAIVFPLHKFHHGRSFILVTDHKPLLALFGPRQFDMDYSEITAPLFKILSKENTVFHLEPSCQMAFEDLKSRLVTDPSYKLFRIPSQQSGDSTVAAVKELISQDTLKQSIRIGKCNKGLISGTIHQGWKSGTIIPSGVPPGLKKLFLQHGYLCRQFWASSSLYISTSVTASGKASTQHRRKIEMSRHGFSGWFVTKPMWNWMPSMGIA